VAEPTRVAIAVITFRRPELLRRLLESLQAQEVTGRYRIRIVVVDNDPSGSARSVVPDGRYPVEYAIEPEPGIPFARETSVRMCAADDALIFVDDDEVAPDGWLETLLGAWRTYDADVVTGPVKGTIPADAPDWNRHSDVHDSTGRRSTGELQNKAYTNNTLVSRKVLDTVTPAFHPAFRHTGSSDLHFFLRVHRAGFDIVWCEQALLREDVPASRTTLRWLVRRAFRSGAGDSISRVLIGRAPLSYLQAAAYGLARIGSAGGYLVLGIVTARKPYLLKALRRFFSGVGTLAGIFGINHDEYAERHTGGTVRGDLEDGGRARPADLADPGRDRLADRPDAGLQ
jgi:succinoglycan biosynthesis protein ExoM